MNEESATVYQIDNKRNEIFISFCSILDAIGKGVGEKAKSSDTAV